MPGAIPQLYDNAMHANAVNHHSRTLSFPGAIPHASQTYLPAAPPSSIITSPKETAVSTPVENTAPPNTHKFLGVPVAPARPIAEIYDYFTVKEGLEGEQVEDYSELTLVKLPPACKKIRENEGAKTSATSSAMSSIPMAKTTRFVEGASEEEQEVRLTVRPLRVHRASCLRDLFVPNQDVIT